MGANTGKCIILDFSLRSSLHEWLSNRLCVSGREPQYEMQCLSGLPCASWVCLVGCVQMLLIQLQVQVKNELIP